jgi:hypothetical protein
MDDSNSTFWIEVEDEHTDEMIAEEIRSCLCASKLKLTLGTVMSLALLKSPYLSGGEITVNDLHLAMQVIKSDLSPADFNNAIQKELEVAWRVWEIIVPDATREGGRKSEIRMFSPEWMADIISGACRGLNLTYQQALWEIPLVMMFHLTLSTSRQYGLITERPKGVREALAKFKEKRRKNG